MYRTVEPLDERMKTFGNYVIRIKNVSTFVSRVISSMMREGASFGIMGPVVYHSSDEDVKNTDCFDKIAPLSWQKEWRIDYLPQYSKLKEEAEKFLNH